MSPPSMNQMATWPLVCRQSKLVLAEQSHVSPWPLHWFERDDGHNCDLIQSNSEPVVTPLLTQPWVTVHVCIEWTA